MEEEGNLLRNGEKTPSFTFKGVEELAGLTLVHFGASVETEREVS